MKIPRDNLVRAVFPGVELRDAIGNGMRTMTGHFATFDQWTEINSVFEGRFLERISPGAFTKTFKEGRAGMKVLFQHGQDPHIGNKPLGAIQTLEEDRIGAHYEVGLLDTSYNRDLLPGLEAGLYGASFRFAVTREDVNTKAKKSAFNPNALPERTIREAQVMEFGPVTFPAYAGATAGVRSMTDAFTLKAFTDDPDALRTLLDYNENVTDSHASAIIPASIPEKVHIVDENGAILDGEERKDYSADQRKQLAKSGEAMPDGSFPIVTVADLENAISAYGRAGDKAAVKAHIMKRARALGRTDLIPDTWKSGMNSTDVVGVIRGEVTALRAMMAPMEDMPDSMTQSGTAPDTAEPATVLDADTCEALCSLIEVMESTLEAMESLLGIDDDTSPDEDDAMMEANSAEPAGAVRTDPVVSTPNAPPSGSAEAEPHPTRGRRDKKKSYLREETPSWQL